MGRRNLRWLAAGILLVLAWLSVCTSRGGSVVRADSALIMGRVLDQQGQPVEGAHVTLRSMEDHRAILEAITEGDGNYALDWDNGTGDAHDPADESLAGGLILHLDRSHYHSADVELDGSQVRSLRAGVAVVLPDATLQRRVGPALWTAATVFLVMLAIIASGTLHNALAALLGMVLVLAISYLGDAIYDDLFIFDFDGALSYVDWNVVFLIMGMMIVIAVVERTGIFQWLALTAYRISRGRVTVLVVILMLIAGVASAFLDNVTTMLLMTPITIQIALVLGISPLALLMPEVMASNVIGVSTLIGTPTNVLIGSYADISFTDFLLNLTPGVLLAFAALVAYSMLAYRKELGQADSASPALVKKLEERAAITEPVHLRKAGWVGAGMLLLFIFGEQVHLMPAVTALLGATALLLWIRPDIEEMIDAVDWTTLVFFIALFVVVGAVQEVGLISLIARFMGRLVGDNLILGMILVTWLSALLSTVVANIPFTAAMLPVVGYLTAIVPGADGRVLFYCLSVGAAMGGNGSLIGASANMVTCGISERAGYAITYRYFLKKGLPALAITVSMALLWLLLRFVLLES